MTQTMTAPIEPESDDALDKARQLLQAGRLEEVVCVAEAVLDQSPSDTEALYLLAVAKRYQKDYSSALEVLSNFISFDPVYGRAYQEQGHNYRQLQQSALALSAYQKAVKFNPALVVSWRELMGLYQRSDDRQGFNIARAEYAQLTSLPPELVSVSSLIHEEKLYKAEQLCRSFLRKQPRHIEAMRLLAMLGVNLSVYDDAEFLLESCVAFEPDNWLARNDYVSILHKRHKFEKALEQASVLRDKYPGNIMFDLAYANINMSLGNFELALNVYRDVIESKPDFQDAHLVRGHGLKTIGRMDEAVEAYRVAYEVRPDFGDAYWSLANLKTYRFTALEIQQMKTQLDEPETTLVDKFHLCFALGKSYEDQADFAQSFHYYQQGNELKKAQVRYKPRVIDNAMARQIDICNKSFFERLAGGSSQQVDPIFIVGLPRAGSTLLEQILASHSQVDGTMELPDIIAIAHRLNGRQKIDDDARYPGVMAEMTDAQFRELGDGYIETTRCHRAGAPYFIDKMPNNFMHIGLIQAIFPNAKIIDARCHSMACCFSGFKQLFADGQEFTYGQQEIARYYKGYVQLMAHWDRVLPGKILRVHYEQVVADLETQVRRILDYCELPFEPACLDFYKTERSVRTPSSEQVRQPIYRGGLEQWRHFEPYLGPMKEVLGALVDEYPLPAA